MSGNSTLAVVVPATDAPPTLDVCVAAVLGAAEPPEELVVVDTASAPGPAAARNEGAARTRADVLVFVDADVVAHPDAFSRIRASFASDPALDAVFGSYDDSPAAPGVVSGFRNLLHHHIHQRGAGDATTFWAGLGAVRRSAFESVGGFDAKRFPEASVEDVELGMRLAEAGHRVRLDPAIRGTHLKHWTLAEMLRVDASRRAFPWAQLVLASGGSRALNLGWRHRLSAVACLVALGAVTFRRPAVALGSAAVFVALNASFYELLLRRRGPGAAAAGVGLHAAHHVAGAAGAAAAVAMHVLGPRR